MKKFLLILLTAVLLGVGLTACGTTKKTYELALITDIGTIDDKSFNQGAWEGLKKYADEKKITYAYYKPTEKTDDAYVAAIDLAVKGGAKVIVTPGYLFEPAVYVAQDKYPNVKFILLDGTPHTPDYKTFRIEKNVYSIFYAEEQSGFLAGYAAVKDGYTSLGFMGGMAVPAVVRFGYGYVQGAEYAAKELGLTNVTVKYAYLGDFAPSAEHKAAADVWFKSGVQVIFAAAGGAGASVFAAAADNSAKAIGVDVNQSAENAVVITSAMKQLGTSVYNGLKAYYDGKFLGGQSVTLDITVDGVGLPQDFSRFKKFTQADYTAIVTKLVADTAKIRTSIKRDTDANNKAVLLTELPLTVVKVTEVK